MFSRMWVNLYKVEVRNVHKDFGSLKTIKDISLTLNEGEFVAILGPSGCGKSTLFNIIAGLTGPDAGEVLVNGKDAVGKTGLVSYMHQKDLLLPWKNILDNVSLPLVLKGSSWQEARKKAEGYFETFGLKGFERHYPRQLSGGMRQRAALLRTYLFSNDIMLLDEPFGGLDAITRRKMHLWLMDIVKTYRPSVLFITHDIDEALFLSDRIYVLSERPSFVKAELKVELPDKRTEKTMLVPEYARLKEKILETLG
jgi:ABC-type nitrate/sulfonate/bicarbonate transport system ATPase subunit